MLLGISTIVRGRFADFIAPELREERRALERAANFDALTGLANRRAFELALPAAEADDDVAIIVFDANNFGKLNKIAGHKFGDIELVKMAACIASAATAFGVPGMDQTPRAFRVGGDEFVVLCPTMYAEPIRAAAESFYGTQFAIRVSIVGTIGATFAEADSKLQKRKDQKR